MKIKIAFICTIIILGAMLMSSSLIKKPKDEELGGLGLIAHDLSYIKHVDSLEFKSNTIVDWLKFYGNIEEGGFKASYGRLFNNDKIAIIVFRGTESWGNVSTDMDEELVPLTTKPEKLGFGCRVHKGFIEAYKTHLRKKLREFTTLLKMWVVEDKVEKIVITGHSLGGALANMLTYDLGLYMKTQNEFSANLMLITFGSPRVGDDCFRKIINDKLNLKVNVRVVYGTDSITTVPYKKEYTHAGTEYDVTSDNLYTAKKFNTDESDRSTNMVGAIFKLVYSITDHLKYKYISKDTILEIIKHNKRLISTSDSTGFKLTKQIAFGKRLKRICN